MNPIDTTASRRLDWLDHQLQTIASLDESTRQTLSEQVERIYAERAALLREQPQTAPIAPTLLATLGFAFTLVPPREKGPRYRDWPNMPKTAEEAARHLARGGNVGVLTGPLSNHIICVDVDRGLSRILAATPELADTLQCHRDDAPDRRKFFVRIDGPMPISTRHIAAECEIDLLSITRKGSAKNATVLGVHPSGDRYQMTGDHILTVRAETFDVWWERWTGGPLTPPPPPRPSSGPGPAPHAPDSLVAQVKAHYSAYDVFDHFGRAGSVTEDHNGGLRLHDQGGLIVGDPNSVDTRHQWYCHSAGVGGDQIDAWCYCQDGRILDRLNKAEFIRTIGEMAAAAGLQAQVATGSGVVDPEQVRGLILGLRQWVKSTSFAGYVPAELQSSVGYRTDSTDTKVARALLVVCEARQSLKVKPSLRYLAELAGLGSHNTVAKALARLGDWFVKTCGDGWYEVDFSTLTTHGEPRTDRPISTITTTDMVNVEKFDFYAESMADSLFASGTSRTVRKQAKAEAKERGLVPVGQVISETRRVIVDNLPVVNGKIVDNPFAPAEMIELQYSTRIVPAFRLVLAEMESGLGEGCLRGIDAYITAGDMDRVELAEETGKAPSSCARITSRLESLGILESYRRPGERRKTYGLTTEWRERLEALGPALKTYRISAERLNRSLEAEQNHQREMLERADEEEAKWRRRKLHAIENRRFAVLGELPELYPDLQDEEARRQWIKTPSAGKPCFDHRMVKEAGAWRSEFVVLMARPLARARENLAQSVSELAGQGGPASEWLPYLEITGYDSEEAKQAIWHYQEVH